jgi:transposase InsO family protein
MQSRAEFCRLSGMPGANVRELCRRFAISSATGYKWLRRFRDQGEAGLADRSRRPGCSPRRSSAAVEAEVLALRRQHPAWGGRKLRRVLQNAAQPAPAASTITAILRRHLVPLGEHGGGSAPHIRFEHAAPNLLWQMDFKGNFALGQGRCHALAVLDDHSRYALLLQACADERTETVQARLEQAFRRYGLPERMLADNGSPWGTSGGADRYTPLALWLLDLGVQLVHGRPYHPQTQGKQERFHRTLAAELLSGRLFHDLAAAQRGFDGWREVYNCQRPHQALDMLPPAARYSASLRAWPGTIMPPEYEPEAFVRRVQQGGRISFQGRDIGCSRAFLGRAVAFRATPTDGVFDLCYRSHTIRRVDLRQLPARP